MGNFFFFKKVSLSACFLALKELFLHRNCVCVQTELWKGWGEKEACLRGRLNKGRLSHTRTSAAQSPSVSGHNQREHMVMGAPRARGQRDRN